MRTKAFTLTEMSAVIAVVLILATMASSATTMLMKRWSPDSNANIIISVHNSLRTQALNSGGSGRIWGYTITYRPKSTITDSEDFHKEPDLRVIPWYIQPTSTTASFGSPYYITDVIYPGMTSGGRAIATGRVAGLIASGTYPIADLNNDSAGSGTVDLPAVTSLASGLFVGKFSLSNTAAPVGYTDEFTGTTTYLNNNGGYLHVFFEPLTGLPHYTSTNTPSASTGSLTTLSSLMNAAPQSITILLRDMTTYDTSTSAVVTAQAAARLPSVRIYQNGLADTVGN